MEINSGVYVIPVTGEIEKFAYWEQITVFLRGNSCTLDLIPK